MAIAGFIQGYEYFCSSYTATGGDEVLYVKNTTSLGSLTIVRIELASSVNQIWTLFRQTSGTAAGTNLTVVAGASGLNGTTIALGNAAVTGTVAGDTFMQPATLAATSRVVEFPPNALILEPGDAIAIDASATGIIYATIIGIWGA